MALAKYYVDPSLGSDTGNGSKSTPWGRASGSVIQYALDTITPGSGGDWINVKSGTPDALSATLDLTTYASSAGATSPLIIAGYDTDEGDGGRGAIDGNGNAVINTGTFEWLVLKDLDFSDWGANICLTCDRYATFMRLLFDGGGIGTVAINTGDRSKIIGCAAFDMSSGNCYTATGYEVSLFRNYAEGDFTRGIYLLGTFASAVGNVIKCTAVGGSGITTTRENTLIAHNTVFCDPAGTGIGINASTASLCQLLNNYVEGFSGTGGYGISAFGNGVMSLNNRAFNNTTNFQIPNGIGTGDTSLSESALIDPTNNDFRPRSGLRYGSYPPTFMHIDQPSNYDVGAIQREDAVIPLSGVWSMLRR